MRRTVRWIDIKKILPSLWKANVAAKPIGRFFAEPGGDYDHLRPPFIPASRP